MFNNLRIKFKDAWNSEPETRPPNKLVLGDLIWFLLNFQPTIIISSILLYKLIF